MLLELASRLHLLIRKRKVIKWHFLPLLASWYVFLTVLNNWWGLSLYPENTKSFSILIFLFYGHLLIVTYLITTSVLPDKVEKIGIDLKEFYFENHSYFWGVSSLSFLMILSRNIYINIEIFPLTVSIIVLGVSILLTISKKYRIHLFGVFIFIIITIMQIISQI
jgi:hypothetical protein